MSGPAVHHIIAREYLESVLKRKYTDASSADFWKKIGYGDFAPVYHLGSQGPDILFFNTNDWPLGGVIKPIAKTYIEVMDFIEEFKKKLMELIPEEVWALISTLETLAADAVERSVLLNEISGIIGDVQNNIDALKTIVETKIEEYVTDSFDLFNIIKHPQQHGQKFSEWWWFDTLHTRRTGRFLKELMMNSGEYSMERAYALGYLTHYAADIVGHPYVNAVSGGPYRTHSQRHKTVENHQDVWAYKEYMKDEFVMSKLSEKYIVDGNIYKLPDQLKEFILKCVRNTYYDNGKSLYGRSMDASDLDISYSVWLKWFTITTYDTELPAPKPYSLTAEIAQAWQQFTGNVGDIADLVGNAMSGNGGILSFFEALAALIAGPFLLAAAIADFIAGSVTTIGAAPLRFFLSLTYEALYNSYMNFRNGVVLNGFAFPYQSGLSNYMTKHMTNTADTDIFGHNARSLPLAHAYPSKKYKKAGMEAESHLIYPWPSAVNLEADQCTGFPSQYYNKTPEWYMTNRDHILNRKRYDYFKDFTEASAANPPVAEMESNFNTLFDIAASNGLGNAVMFSDVLYADFIADGPRTEFGDFNLDSDRGYAFKCWRKVKDKTLVNTAVNDSPTTNAAVESDNTVKNIQTDIIDPNGGAVI